jgi:NTP pyrophosphatase (non-canonical NTP hydrolase)
MNNELSIKKLQESIKNIDHKNNAVDKYFYKLSEEVGELAKVIRKNQRLSDTGDIKDTIEEELQDVLYYVVCLANIYDIDLEQCIYLKEQINAKKYGRKPLFE